MGKNKILVVGSSNVDMIVKVDTLPLPGQTVGNGKFEQAFGGKGANQAVAAARMGGGTEFITYLGNDLYAETLKKYYKENNLDTDRILISRENPTGVALIYVSKDAENCIAVAPGSNYELTKEVANNIENLFVDCALLVLQAEIPYETVKELIHSAHSRKIKILFNPAPACDLEKETISCINYLVLNQGELEEVSGLKIEEKGLAFIADKLITEGVENIIVTLGKQGVYFKNKEKQIQVKSFQVKALDTTGAGDTFCGALAVKIAENGEITKEVLEYCCAASAISVTRSGAQPSIPKHEEVAEFLKINN